MIRYLRTFLIASGVVLCSGCLPVSQNLPKGQVYAPKVKEYKSVNQAVEVGHRLLQAQEYNLAIDAFSRAALLNKGMSAEILSGLGTAHLSLGQLGEAEKLLRRASAQPDAYAEVWNNLGVVLMERGNPIEAEQIFHKAFAMSNGENITIRDNLRKAIAKTQIQPYTSPQGTEYKLTRRGNSDYLIETGL